MKVGDLVKCITVSPDAIGIITKIDMASNRNSLKQRYWVLLQGKRSSFPFMDYQIEVVNESR